MFSQSDGPTALRADLVHALSLSVGLAQFPEGEGTEACAALSGVWNGRKGYVAILVRWVDAPLLRRYAFADPLLTRESLLEAVDEGLGFIESMGFVMDCADFVELKPEMREQRLRIWNEVRKLDCMPSLVEQAQQQAAAPRSRQVLARIPVVSRVREPGGAAGAELRLRAQF